ncbi:MAG: hypothetical protein R6V12_12580, partial [Candidatus Hydrogenedentota bacterium]
MAATKTETQESTPKSAAADLKTTHGEAVAGPLASRGQEGNGDRSVGRVAWSGNHATAEETAPQRREESYR